MCPSSARGIVVLMYTTGASGWWREAVASSKRVMGVAENVGMLTVNTCGWGGTSIVTPPSLRLPSRAMFNEVGSTGVSAASFRAVLAPTTSTKTAT